MKHPGDQSGTYTRRQVQNEVRIAYLVTHPIQYQAPLLSRITQEADIRLKTFFASDLSLGRFHDSGFDSTIQWDVPLLNGYDYEFLPSIGSSRHVSAWRPFSRGLRKRLRSREFDILWVHGYARPQHWFAMSTAKHVGMKVFLRDEATAIASRRSLSKRLAKRGFFAWLDRIVDAFLTIGTLNQEYYVDYGIREERMFSMPYAVDNRLFRLRVLEAAPHRDRLRDALGLSARRPILLFAGKLIERKRPDDLLEAYARMALCVKHTESIPYLLYIGEGHLRQRLQERALTLRLDSVKFLGFKNQSELPAFYDLCDVFVMPTVSEPWGLVVNEVMNAGRAVVISDEVGCARDLVENRVNGLLFRARDVADLSRALSEVLIDPIGRTRMGAKSLERINQWSFEQDVAGLRAAIAATIRGTDARRTVKLGSFA